MAENKITAMARKLYLVMPGADRIERDEKHGYELWGEVEETEHYKFCWTVAELIVEGDDA